jgi:hypothetical protein
MPHSRPLIAGLMRLPVRDFAAFGGDTQPRKDGVMRPRLASLHPPCALLPTPFRQYACALRGSRRRMCVMFPVLQGGGNQVPPRTLGFSE